MPFVNAWFPPERRGFAIGVFGAGMGGTAISALTTVKLVNAHGTAAPFLITAVALAAVRGGGRPGAARRARPAVSIGAAVARLRRRSGCRSPGRPAALYAIGFGGYVAFSVYLPTYLKNAYGLTPSDASNKMAGFVVVAVVMRPVGGWLSDRIRPGTVLSVAFAVVAVGRARPVRHPDLHPVGTLVFLTMAAALGAACGATFALVAQRRAGRTRWAPSRASSAPPVGSAGSSRRC